MIKIYNEHIAKKGEKKTRQGQGRGSKFGIKGSKKYYRKKKRGQG
tara:strand:- start:111 stop:245 length:135 start_codon:yes stop_codon:yes gene_type:complete